MELSEAEEEHKDNSKNCEHKWAPFLGQLQFKSAKVLFVALSTEAMTTLVVSWLLGQEVVWLEDSWSFATRSTDHTIGAFAVVGYLTALPLLGTLAKAMALAKLFTQWGVKCGMQ